MNGTIDLINAPVGYAEDIEVFCLPIIEVALLRGETEFNFDPDYLYEMLDKNISEKEEEIILYNARRYLCDNRIGDDPAPYDAYQEEFEHGCQYFISDFLRLNQLHALFNLDRDVWKIKLKRIVKGRWSLTCSKTPAPSLR